MATWFILSGILIVLTVISIALEEKKDHKRLQQWKAKNPQATNSEVEAEEKCLELIRTSALGPIGRFRVRSWKKKNPKATPGDVASKIIEIKGWG